jgi:hypothetical protein
VSPGHDVNVLLFEQLRKQRALVSAPRHVMRIEKAADEKIGFLGAAMVRPPVEAFQVGVGKHAAHVVSFSSHCERRETR